MLRSLPIVISMSIATWYSTLMVFNIDMEDLHRKAWLVVGDHMTHISDVITYSSVVTSALTMAALHDQELKSADVLNACVVAPNREKRWTVLCPEFGDNAGKSAIIITALCCLKSAGALFRANLAQFMQSWCISHLMLTSTCG